MKFGGVYVLVMEIISTKFQQNNSSYLPLQKGKLEWKPFLECIYKTMILKSDSDDVVQCIDQLIVIYLHT